MTISLNFTAQFKLEALIEVLAADQRVIFAYLYGSAARNGPANDIDIAVYAASDGVDVHQLSADLKIALHKKTGLAPDSFDIRILNGLPENGDVFALLYLKNVLQQNLLLTDKTPELRSDFLEAYAFRYRECEGLIQEVLA